ncbi:hypothetical protein [Devosia sp.]|uniref:hypothetical protein n=1 Tax=Devosia sp. TaxID=1871048 RepID=UPI003F707DC6
MTALAPIAYTLIALDDEHLDLTIWRSLLEFPQPEINVDWYGHQLDILFETTPGGVELTEFGECEFPNIDARGWVHAAGAPANDPPDFLLVAEWDASEGWYSTEFSVRDAYLHSPLGRDFAAALGVVALITG